MATPTDDLVQALVARLQDALPALVAAEGLKPLTAFLNHDPGVPTPAKAPLAWVDISGDRRSTDARRGATVHKYSHQTTFLVGVTSSGPDPGEAARHLRKYVDLARRCLEGDQTAGGNALWVEWQGTDYSPNMGGNSIALFKEAVLTFDLNYRTRIGQG